MKRRFFLIVEDSPDDLLLMQRVFKKYNIDIDILTAKDGAEALDYLLGDLDYKGKSDGIMPTIILLDLKLPKINGIEVLGQLRSNDKTKLIPIVIITSSKEEKDVINSYKLGVNSYVRKPIVYEEFCETLRHIGIYWSMTNEPLP